MQFSRARMPLARSIPTLEYHRPCIPEFANGHKPWCIRSNSTLQQDGLHFRWRLSPGVPPSPGIPPNREQVQKHAEAIADHVHPCCGIVCPSHRNFRGAQCVALGQKQDLRIKSEALRPLVLKYGPCFRGPKCLETALCVLKWQSCYATNEAVENYSSLLPKCGLMHLNELAVYRTRADNDVISIAQRRQ